jgi:hypothetical protein
MPSAEALSGLACDRGFVKIDDPFARRFRLCSYDTLRTTVTTFPLLNSRALLGLIAILCFGGVAATRTARRS